jgi:hypothetical protein
MPEWAKVLVGSLALMIGAALGPTLIIEGVLFLKPPDAESRKHRTPEHQSDAQQIPLIGATEPTQHGDAESAGKADKEKELANATWGLVKFTAALVFVAAIQACLFVWQLVLMNRGVRDAREAAGAATKAAAAASLHATAVVRSEMPVVRLHSLQIKPHGERFDISIIAGPPPQHSEISVEFFNYGRTPAFPFCISMGGHIAPVLPEQPPYIRIINFEPGMVIDRNSEFLLPDKYITWITDEKYKEICEMIVDHRTNFWFFGKLEFEDFLGVPHAWRFCVRWAPFLPAPTTGGSTRGGFVEDGPANYREQQRGRSEQ